MSLFNEFESKLVNRIEEAEEILTEVLEYAEDFELYPIREELVERIKKFLHG